MKSFTVVKYIITIIIWVEMNTVYVVLIFDHSNHYNRFVGIKEDLYHPLNTNVLIPALIREVTLFSYS